MNTFIFDLDGTLLPMPDQELFLKTYFNALSKKVMTQGIDPQKLVKAVWAGTGAMVENDGTMTNEQRFWLVFYGIMGEEAKKLEPVFDHFYRNEFIDAKSTTYSHPNAALCIRALKEKGYRVALATNPLFPRIATYTRMQWAGLKTDDFELITTYENSSFCKPNLKYYEEILSALGRKADECIMVGNDVKEDMCVAKLGMDTFLLNECLINSEEADITGYKQGNFDELLEMIRQLPEIL
jgi:FMN phosphatase YigB (HAD superfamily)